MASARRRRAALVAAALAAALAALGVGLLIGGTVVDDEPRRSRPVAVPPAPAAGELSVVRDRRGGFAIRLPRTWTRLPSDDPQVRLLAAGSGGASVLVRAHGRVGLPRERRLAAFREYTRRVLAGSGDLRLVGAARRVRLADRDGFSYLYTFRDRGSGRPAAHSHVMLLDGDRVLALVFQALPAEGFRALAPTFDRIAASLRVQRVQ